MGLLDEIQKALLIQECEFRATTSSGPGGQHVNKVNTRIELRLDIRNSKVLSEDAKIVIFEKLTNRINSDGILIITAQDERSQLKNKEHCTIRLFELIAKALKPVKKRRPTKPSLSSIKKRLENKRIIALKKEHRKPPEN
ncbi:MAG: aminoacyl-tRNA hydrolase [Bacteroidales bacterium]|nr:aminoacyl-tRNA hydrolase [Bacteroidales bacterium]MCF8405001.1 aminoacyl-tRNA hydrolase [Bacteroidales bacterium]